MIKTFENGGGLCCIRGDCGAAVPAARQVEDLASPNFDVLEQAPVRETDVEALHALSRSKL